MDVSLLTPESLSPASGLGDELGPVGKRKRGNGDEDIVRAGQRLRTSNSIEALHPVQQLPSPPAEPKSSSEPADPVYELYQYRPLLQEKEIRLLKVSASSPCTYDIIHTTLAEAPPYQTISYVWGPDIRDKRLTFESEEVIMINENLASALPYLCPRCDTGYLWIDQICIDQVSTLERNHQVKIMGLIYGAGQDVLIWLGRADGEGKEWSLHDLKLLRDLKHKVESSIDACESTYLLEDKFISLWTSPDAYRRTIGRLLANPWFRRGWVFQELVLSPKARFVSGSMSISALALYWLAKSAHNYLPFSIGFDQSSLAQDAFEALLPMLNSWAERHSLAHHSPMGLRPFYAILSALAPKLLTSDPHDRVYAFLGLKQDLRIVLEPDYAISLPQMLINTAVACIQGTDTLNILGYVRRKQHRVFDLPSWVPDFTLEEACLPMRAGFRSRERIRFRGDHSQLITQGKVVDRVLSVHDTNPPFTWSKSGLRRCDIQSAVDFASRVWPSSWRTSPAPTVGSVLGTICAGGYLIRGCQFNEKELLDDWKSSEAYVDERWKYGLIDASKGADGRRIFLAASGRLGLCSDEVGPDDELCILRGCMAPVVLRRRTKETYNVIETCFLQNAMLHSERVDWEIEPGEEFILV